MNELFMRHIIKCKHIVILYKEINYISEKNVILCITFSINLTSVKIMSYVLRTAPGTRHPETLSGVMFDRIKEVAKQTGRRKNFMFLFLNNHSIQQYSNTNSKND